MPPDSTVAITSSSPSEILALLANAFALLGGLAALAAAYFTQFLPWWRTRRDRRSLKQRVGAELYPEAVIERSTRFYIEPFCQVLDPAGAEEPRHLAFNPKDNLFKIVDDALHQRTEHRYLILLADSGMGKTSFLLNYYARHVRRRRREFELALMPLGIPDADDRIRKIANKANTVLFLDALDEDTLAIVDHVGRLRDLLDLTRDFKRVLITCRTQFFPKDEEIPSETGIVKVGPRRAGEKAQHFFHKLYLSPFTDAQVQDYLKRRYPFWQRRRRWRARAMVATIPNLSVRPMLLAHIDDLVNSGRPVKYAFELYEEMVEAWLVREEGIVPGLRKKPLREFSERLAVELHSNSRQRGAERIPREELAELAKAWHIPLDDWQLTGRSLLNRDAHGNYKFAHRSILEYLVVKRLLDGDPAWRQAEWTDQMKAFLDEMIRKFTTVSKRIPEQMHKFLTEMLQQHTTLRSSIPFDPVACGLVRSLRSEPIEDLHPENVQSMLTKYGFFDSNRQRGGNGISHLYELRQDGKVVVDQATGLIWQQAGSDGYISYKGAHGYVAELNRNKRSGFDDWRLPTLEEAMSLLEPEKRDGLYLDPVFDRKQQWIWTTDYPDAGAAWVVAFNDGGCYDGARVNYYGYVRAVRSGQSNI